MKTKHYLLVSAAVAIGIIAGVLISTGIMRNQQRNFVQNRMEMRNGNFGQGGFQNMRGGGQYRGQGMNRGQMNNMGFMNRNANFSQFFVRQLNLTNDQEEKINTILDRNREMRESIWSAREDQHVKKMEEIKSILTDEQIEQLENLQSKRGRNGQRGMRQRGRM